MKALVVVVVLVSLVRLAATRSGARDDDDADSRRGSGARPRGVAASSPKRSAAASRLNTDDKREPALSPLIRHALKTWNVPGAAVVVVRDDRIVLLAGYGHRDQEKKTPVTPDTLFALSSCSKAFTTAALALLADEGKLTWDDRVRDHLPWFALSDPLADREVRLRDLLCHRTGLGPHELLWYRAPWSPKEAVRRSAHLPLSRPFRTQLQYQSTMYTAAGLAAARAAGESWEDLIRKRLLVPLGMKSTCLSLPEARRRKPDNLASPHRLDSNGEVEVIPHFDSPHADPAISVFSSARDLGQWLRFHLGEGLLPGEEKRLVSARRLRETHSPQMVVRLSKIQKGLFPDTTQYSYAMGWTVYDHKGVRLIAHGGAIDGMRTHLVFAPEKKLGLAILANLDRTSLPVPLAMTLLEKLLELPGPRRDWHRMHRDALEQLAEAQAERRKQRLARRRHDTRPSRELAAYAGTYSHPAYGSFEVRLQRGKGLVWRWRDEETVLQHFHHDTFLVEGETVGLADLIFSLDRTGAVSECRVTGNLDVTFHRQKNKPIPRRPSP